MQEKLVIYLHAQDMTRPSWAVACADSSIKKSVNKGDPSELADEVGERDVIVIVPAEDVLLTTVMLPKMNRSRLAQAIPFALEEQLVADVDALHFAAGVHKPGVNLPIAIVAREKMQQWIEMLKSWHISPDVMIPLSLALPLEQNTWHVLIDDLVVLRSGLAEGFASDRNNFSAMLDLAMTSSGYVPSVIQIHNFTNHAFATALRVTSKVNEDFLEQTQLIEMLATYSMNVPPVNLLQGAFAGKKKKMPQMGKVVKAITYLGISWVFLLFLYPVMSYLILHHRVSNIDTQIAQIYKRHFPQASSIVEPKIRMQEKLQKLTAQIGENRLLFLMGYVGKGMAQTPTIKLKRLDFQTSQLTLELTAATSEDFSAFTDYLTQSGLSVKQQSANLTGERINATIVIE